MSNDRHDDKLRALRHTETPAPTEAARRRALAAAMQAFDAEQDLSAAPAKGQGWRARLSSIVPSLKGNWIMDTRLSFGLGTAAVALLLLPLGYQLYTSTAVTPVSTLPSPQPEAVRQIAPPAVPAEVDAGRGDAASAPQQAEEAAPVAPMAAKQASGERPQRAGEVATAAAPAMPEAADNAASGAMESEAGGVAEFDAMPMHAPAPEGFAARPAGGGDEFTEFEESPVKVVAEEPVSTFSIDVDTASYAYVRRALNEGRIPEPAAVRVEELINYFAYGYPAPETAETPFRPSLEVYPTPWNVNTQLLRIGIKGYEPPLTEDRASNLVFLIDTSGSMDEPDRLPLLKRAFALLVSELSANDTVSIVAYAGSAGIVLEPTPATEKAAILGALERLWAGGSTAGAEGIELAYRLAERNKVADGINRVILATDGDFNVGISDPDELVRFIRSKRDGGVFLSVLGFGQGNLNDDTMQALAQNGNGNASYIDSFREAQKVLVEEGGGTLETIAKDVKIQVEFNPAVVSQYRLVGYETRSLRREDFNNDRVDAGEIGAGHTVTAIYEITPVGSGGLVDPLRYGSESAASPADGSDEIGFLKMRYKLPDAESSRLLEQPIEVGLAVDDISEASDDARFAAAVAAFGQKLKGSDYGGDMSWDAIGRLAQGARGSDESGHRAEFKQLVDMAAALAPDAE